MQKHPDFKELLRSFKEFEVRFLVVGGYAVTRYANPRLTKDLDLWVSTDPDNARRTFDALKSFGAPLAGLTASDFTDPESFYQMGVPPLRVDIMLFVTGLDFDSAWENREEARFHDVVVPFISLDDLITSKKALGRPQDLIDVATLENARRQKQK